MAPRRLLLAFALTLLPAVPASAGTPTHIGLREVFASLLADPTIPAEWAGVWQTTDSTFTCAGMFFGATVGELDTLCAGIPITEEDPNGQITLTCSGTATADEVHVTCNGSGPIDVDCDATITVQIDGVRTGDTYSATSTINTVTMGTGVGCGSAFCIETRTTGVRVAPEPVAYCSTQNETTTWGRVKVLYR